MTEEDEMWAEEDKRDARRDIAGVQSVPKGECGYIRCVKVVARWRIAEAGCRDV